MPTRILWSVSVLAVLWVVLPVPLPNPSSGPSSSECLTLSDAPPDLERADLVPVFERCSASNPTDVELMADLGLFYESAGRWSDAEAVYRRALRVDPDYADLRIRLGRLLLKRSDSVGARMEAEAALKVQPNRRAPLDLLHDADPE
jgi:cytochrome c-type biogenesis protein CcmH/NrfG